MEAVLDAMAKVDESEMKRIEANRRLEQRAQAQAQAAPDGT